MPLTAPTKLTYLFVIFHSLISRNLGAPSGDPGLFEPFRLDVLVRFGRC